MASVRRLKKEVNWLTNELVDECLIYLTFHPETSDEKMDQVLRNIIEGRNEVILKINARPRAKGTKEVKAYYKEITDLVKKKMIGSMDMIEK